MSHLNSANYYLALYQSHVNAEKIRQQQHADEQRQQEILMGEAISQGNRSTRIEKCKQLIISKLDQAYGQVPLKISNITIAIDIYDEIVRWLNDSQFDLNIHAHNYYIIRL